jgi:ceramide glucosyltransferase
MADSDIRVGSGLLRTLASEFADERTGVITCPYRAVPGRSLWSRLEALGMNTEFWGTAFTARQVEGGVHFAVGPTCAARRRAVNAAGGWLGLGRYLAEDFVLGQRATAAGEQAVFSAFVVEHRIGSQPWRSNFAHRLRWNRSTRRSRPAGYLGQVFTNPLPVALLALPWVPFPGMVLAITAFLRAAAACAVARHALQDVLTGRYWYWVPLQDLLSFTFWLAGFRGDAIEWRGARYRLNADGKLD